MIDENAKRIERAQAVAAGVRAGVSSKLGSIWWAFLLRGIFFIALGIFALFWPRSEAELDRVVSHCR